MGRIPLELEAVRQRVVSQRPNLTDPLNLFTCTQDTNEANCAPEKGWIAGLLQHVRVDDYQWGKGDRVFS